MLRITKIVIRLGTFTIFLGFIEFGLSLVDSSAFRASSASASEAPNIEVPNILYIMLDDMDIQDLTSYGSTDTFTPRMDLLAEGGMRFTNFYAAAAECSPSRVGLLTSRFPIELGFTRAVTETSPVLGSSTADIQFKGGIPREVPTIAELLSPTYQTAHFGKWHVGLWKDEYAPPAKGFDQSYVMKGSYTEVAYIENNNTIWKPDGGIGLML